MIPTPKKESVNKTAQDTCEPMVQKAQPLEEQLIVTREHFNATMEDNQALVQVSRQRVDKIVQLEINLHQQRKEIQATQDLSNNLLDILREAHALACELGQEIPAPWNKGTALVALQKITARPFSGNALAQLR